MKIQFNPKSFLKTFRVVAAAAATRDTKPNFQNVRLSTCGAGHVSLQATDTAVGINTLAECDVVVAGDAMMPVKRMIDILKATKETILTLESSKGYSKLYSATTQCELVAYDPEEEFPEIPVFSHKSYHELTTDALVTAIHRTIFAVDKEDILGVVRNVSFESEENTVITIATSGKHMAIQRSQGVCVGKHTIPEKVSILSALALKLLVRTMKEFPADKVKVAFEKDRAHFQWGNTTMFARLAAGRFPTWRPIVPEASTDSCAKVNVGELLGAIQGMAVVAEGYANIKGVNFTFLPGILSLQARKDNTKTAIPIKYEKKKESIIGWDVSLVEPMLKSLDKDMDIAICLSTDQTREDYSVSKWLTEDSFTYVLMALSEPKEGGKAA